MSNRNGYIIIATIFLIGAALTGARFFSSGSKNLPVYSNLSEKGDLINLKYTNQSNHEVTMNAYSDKVLVVDFIFTHCPTICPVMTANMREIQKVHSDIDELQFLSFSVDPGRDSVPRLQYFADLFEADTGNWHFLTGDKKNIYRIAREGFAVTAMEGDGGPDDFIHSPIMVLLDKKTNVRGFYDGTDTSAVQTLIADIGQLLKNN
ncbi:MAG: SCO family protein [Bacteroidetes bacterium]|nr:SCO family protein [Bacteroidota bacterium]